MTNIQPGGVVGVWNLVTLTGYSHSVHLFYGEDRRVRREYLFRLRTKWVVSFIRGFHPDRSALE